MIRVTGSRPAGGLYDYSLSPFNIEPILTVTHAEIIQYGNGNDCTAECPNLRHAEVHFLRFHLLNLELPDFTEQTTQSDNGIGITQPHVWLDVFGKAIALEPVKGYRAVIEDLSATEGSATTVLASISILPDETIEDIQSQIKALTAVLSLVQGTRVNWIGYDIVSRQDKVIYSYVYNAASSQFKAHNSVFSVEFVVHLGASRWKSIVEPMCEHFKLAEHDWRIYSAINLFNDARMEKSFLEFRGLKFAGCIEALRHEFLRRHDREFIIAPSNLFDDAFKAKENKQAFKDLLLSLVPNATLEQLEMLINNAQGINRYPFRRALREMCKEIGFYGDQTHKAASETSLATFVAIRRLSGAYRRILMPMGQATMMKRLSKLGGNNLRFLEQFTGHFLLALLCCPKHSHLFKGLPPEPPILTNSLE